MRSTSFLDALTMSLLNFCVALILTALHLVNALYDWPNPFVTVAAPLAAAIFFVVTALWFLKLTRSGGAHRAAATPLSAAIVPAPQRARMARLLNGFSSRRWTRSAVG